jgi:hypothetical protein
MRSDRCISDGLNNRFVFFLRTVNGYKTTIQRAKNLKNDFDATYILDTMMNTELALYLLIYISSESDWLVMCNLNYQVFGQRAS